MKYQRLIFVVICIICFCVPLNNTNAEELVKDYDIFIASSNSKDVYITNESIISNIYSELSYIKFDLYEINSNDYTVIEFYLLPEIIRSCIMISIADTLGNNIRLEYTKLETLILENSFAVYSIDSYNNQMHKVKILIENREYYKSIEFRINEESIYNYEYNGNLIHMTISSKEPDKFSILKENNQQSEEDDNDEHLSDPSNPENTHDETDSNDNEEKIIDNTDNIIDEEEQGNIEKPYDEQEPVPDEKNQEVEVDETEDNVNNDEGEEQIVDNEEELIEEPLNEDEGNTSSEDNHDINNPVNDNPINDNDIVNSDNDKSNSSYIEENISLDLDADKDFNYIQLFASIILGIGIISLFVMIHKQKSID